MPRATVPRRPSASRSPDVASSLALSRIREAPGMRDTAGIEGALAPGHAAATEPCDSGEQLGRTPTLTPLAHSPVVRRPPPAAVHVFSLKQREQRCRVDRSAPLSRVEPQRLMIVKCSVTEPSADHQCCLR